MPDDKMEEMFEHIRRASGNHKEKVVKSIKPTEEEVLEWMALEGFRENAEKARGVWESKKSLFWSKVELRTGEVTRRLHYNDKKNVIEILMCDHDHDDSSPGDGFES